MNEGDYIIMNSPAPEGLTESGYLIVTVSAARGAIPLSDAIVTVNFADAEHSVPYAVLITDRSGKTPRLSLPAPPRNLSLSPSNGGTPMPLPYAQYNIEIVKEGYYPAATVGVPIFSEVTAIQNINLIPASEELPQTFYRDGTIYTDERGGYNL